MTGAHLAGLALPVEPEGSPAPWLADRPEGLTGGDILSLERLSRVVRSSGVVLSIPDLRQCPERSLLSRGSSVRSFLGVPIPGADAAAGCLYVADRTPRLWDEHQQGALRDLALLVGFDLANRLGSIERRRLENQVRTLDKAVENMQLGVTVTDLEGRIVYSNPAEARMHGYAVGELIGEPARVLGPRESGAALNPSDLRMVGSWTRETVNVRKDGTRFPVLLWSDLVRDPDGRTIGIVTCAEDITERKRTEQALREQATRDVVTGVPNRVLFLERLEAAIARRRTTLEGRFAVLFLDLDRFKVVNDSLGHHIGDELLAAVAVRLSGCLRTSDTLARFGGDEFAILLEEIGGAADAVSIAQRIQVALAEPFHLHGYELFTSASIGIVTSSAGEEEPEYLWRSADVAMYRAKARGNGQFEVFDQSMHANALSRLQLETDLRRAVERNELHVYFQPVLELADRRVVGFEALLRWSHPQLGPVNPAEVIAIAEETGMIGRIGEWVLREACGRYVEIREQEGIAGHPWLAVNVSSKQLSQPDLLERVSNALSDTGMDATDLRLEITESGVIENTETVLRTLHRLKALGVQLYMDDFGTGYASLSYLHTVPLDALKIDLSFVSRMSRGNRHAQIVETIVQLARSVSLRVIAEGIATEDQLELLREFGCDLGQGFLFSPPVTPAEAFQLAGSAD